MPCIGRRAGTDRKGARVPQPTALLTDIVLGESPRWHDDRLWFCDWGGHEVVAVDVEGRREVILPVDSLPFSIDWQPDGRLLVLSADDRRLRRRELDGSLTVLAELRDLSDHPWNEIVVDGRGNSYVNGIGFDLMGGQEASPGIIAVVTPDGAARTVGDGLLFPNGMAVTPDNSTLIVAESYGQRLTAFTIDADGSLSERRLWADLGDGVPDGICLDADGAIWYADVPNARCVRVREGGDVLQTVEVDRGCFACMLGGADGTMLFILAATWRGPQSATSGPRAGQLLTIPAPAPHAGRP